MAIPRYTAVQFRRPMERGLNRPFLVLAEAENGKGSERVALVVKSTAGYRNRPECIVREMFALLLARKVGISVPEPVLVKFPKGFDYGAADHPEHAELIRRSPGWNLATVHLGNSWNPWTNTSPPRSIDQETIDSAYCFDAMVQNSDRENENPNLLWKRDQLVLLDFDKAFGHLRVYENDPKPWRKVLALQNLQRHCFYRFLPQLKEGELLGNAIWEAFGEWYVTSRKGALSREFGSKLQDPKVDLPVLEEYLTNLADHTEDFFRYLTEISRS